MTSANATTAAIAGRVSGRSKTSRCCSAEEPRSSRARSCSTALSENTARSRGTASTPHRSNTAATLALPPPPPSPPPPLPGASYRSDVPGCWMRLGQQHDNN